MKIEQRVGILVDGNNIQIRAHNAFQNKNLMIDFDNLIPRILGQHRSLCKFFYFREGENISKKFSDRLRKNFHGITEPCFKSADSVLTIRAIEICEKVDTIVLFSGDVDYLNLVKYLKTKGVSVELASMKVGTSKELMEEVDCFHEIFRNDFFEFNFNPNHTKEVKKE